MTIYRSTFTIIKPLLKYCWAGHEYFLSCIAPYYWPIFAIIYSYDWYSYNLMWLFETNDPWITEWDDHPVSNIENMLFVLLFRLVKRNIYDFKLKLVSCFVLVNAIHFWIEFLQMRKKPNARRTPVSRKEDSKAFYLLQLFNWSVFD